MTISGTMYRWGERAKYVQEEAGVYVLYNMDKAVMFVGGSANLRETFTRYLETNFSDDPRKRGTGYYRREFTPNWEGRVKELLDEYSQTYGTLPELNIPAEPSKGEVVCERGFHFYEDVGKPLSEVASSLEELREKIGKVPPASLEFHQRRGDFAIWVRDVLKEAQLALKIEEIRGVGEDLRRELLNTLGGLETVECPVCGTQSSLVKTWEMAGKPSKAKHELRLTIGLYKCSNCNKTFRKTLKKQVSRVIAAGEKRAEVETKVNTLKEGKIEAPAGVGAVKVTPEIDREKILSKLNEHQKVIYGVLKSRGETRLGKLFREYRKLVTKPVGYKAYRNYVKKMLKLGLVARKEGQYYSV